MVVGRETINLMQIIKEDQVEGKPGRLIQAKENVGNFLEALKQLGFPSAAIFSSADLDSDGPEERQDTSTLIFLLLNLTYIIQTMQATRMSLAEPNTSVPNWESRTMLLKY